MFPSPSFTLSWPPTVTLPLFMPREGKHLLVTEEQQEENSSSAAGRQNSLWAFCSTHRTCWESAQRDRGLSWGSLALPTKMANPKQVGKFKNGTIKKTKKNVYLNLISPLSLSRLPGRSFCSNQNPFWWGTQRVRSCTSRDTSPHTSTSEHQSG